ncbi:MFS transporter [Chloropicon primus]|uniref:MFS transporter n=2 Tax=Chloropicon primus TaxID=1764295 RepID=A0A5B8MDM2_9CHLO|nr:MFS transporter [Chloropicon primus]UPQ97884.1 MFS transporter [Chloropicon primus]|eukprot:QDZ18676.1 MFS transporter [Chloropicon primus]
MCEADEMAGEKLEQGEHEHEELMPEGDKKSAALEIEIGDDETRPRSSFRALIISSVFGNVLEWYDFGVFASFSTEISKAFFTGGRLEEILEVYGVFAVAFFVRPLGGFVLGIVGDKYGRTLSLQISVVAMGLSALIISLLPTNDVGPYSIGPAATILLVVVRSIQGLSVGGEMVGSMLYMVENVPERWKAVVSCVPMASAISGTGMGYLVSTIITALLSEEARVLWGWRLAFGLGVPAGLVGFMFRSCLHESHTFSSAIKKFGARHQNQHPFFYAMKNEPAALFVLSALLAVLCGFYSSTVWYNEAWLEMFYTELVRRGLSELQGRILNTLLIFAGLAGGSMGYAAFIDRGPKVPLHYHILGSAFLLAIFSPLFLWLMSFGRDCLLCVAGGQLAGMLCFTPTIASLSLYLVSEIPTQLQYTSIALSYNIAQALFGGTIPYIATAIVIHSSNIVAPSFYMSGLAVLGGGSILLARLPRVRRMHQNLEQTMNT